MFVCSQDQPGVRASTAAVSAGIALAECMSCATWQLPGLPGDMMSWRYGGRGGHDLEWGRCREKVGRRCAGVCVEWEETGHVEHRSPKSSLHIEHNGSWFYGSLRVAAKSSRPIARLLPLSTKKGRKSPSTEEL